MEADAERPKTLRLFKIYLEPNRIEQICNQATLDTYHIDFEENPRDTHTTHSREILRYDEKVAKEYDVEDIGNKSGFGRLGKSVGGVTRLDSGTITYSDAYKDSEMMFRDPDFHYKSVVEHESWHKVQLKKAKEHGITTWDLMAIKPYLEGQTASLLGQNVYADEQVMYANFMSSFEGEKRQDPYSQMIDEVFNESDLIIINGLIDRIFGTGFGNKLLREFNNKFRSNYDEKIYNYLEDLENYARTVNLHPESHSVNSSTYKEAEKEFTFSIS